MKGNEERIVRKLIKDIQQELTSLEEIYSQIGPVIEKGGEAKEQEKVFFNRAAGSILHDFYTGIEKIFCDIANKIDKEMPKSEDWHISLLRSMAAARGNRQEVISSDLMDELKEYLGFRHLFRNIYGAELDWDRLKHLLAKIQNNLWERLKADLDSFIKKVGRF